MKRIELLDYGRFLAACSVMIFHYTFNGIRNGKITSLQPYTELNEITKYGYLGVEFFFIVSGFVIAFSYRGKTSGEFLTSRAIRILPAFWGAVLFTGLIAGMIGGNGTIVSVPQIIANLTFLPQIFGYDFVDGVYWTLLYECFFYVWIFATLFVGGQPAVDVFFKFWPFILVTARLVGLSHLPLLGGYFCFFALGSAFASMEHWPKALTFVAIPASAVLCLEFSLRHATELGGERGVDYAPAVIATLVAGMLVFFCLLTIPKVRKLQLPGSRALGALTYPLYLIHAHFGFMILSRFASEEMKWVAVTTMMAIALGMAWMLHVVLEEWPSDLWKRLFGRILGRPADVLNLRLRNYIQAAWMARL